MNMLRDLLLDVTDDELENLPSRCVRLFLSPSFPFTPPFTAAALI